MADTHSLHYAFPNLVKFEVPFMDGASGYRNFVSKHACSFKFSSNLLASRMLTGNPGLPVDPQVVNGFEAKAAHLAYLSNLFWDVVGGIPAKPVLTQFAARVTGGSISYYTAANE